MANGNITNKDLYEAIENLEKKLMREVDHKVDQKVFDARIDPIQKIVYALVGAVLLGVVGSVMALVLKGDAI